MANDEGSTLLPDHRNNTPPTATREATREATRRLRRSQLVRVALGVVAALALVAGSVAAVDMVAKHQQQPRVQATTSLSAVEPTAMDAQFGWGTWCSARATIGCLLSSDKDTCKKEVLARCDPEEEPAEEHGGDGSGSGSRSGSGSSSASPHREPNVGDAEHYGNGTRHRNHAPTPTETTAAPPSAPETQPTTAPSV